MPVQLRDTDHEGLHDMVLLKGAGSNSARTWLETW